MKALLLLLGRNPGNFTQNVAWEPLPAFLHRGQSSSEGALPWAWRSGPSLAWLGDSGWTRVERVRMEDGGWRCAGLRSFSDGQGDGPWPSLPLAGLCPVE